MRHPYAQTNLELYDQLISLDCRPDDLRTVRDAYEFAAVEFGNLFRASGRPFINHLVSTASILAAHGASSDLITCGLLHDIYGQGSAGLTAFAYTPTSRLALRMRLGEEVEEILAKYFHLKQKPEEYIHRDINQISLAVGRAVIVRVANDLDEYLCGEYHYSSKPTNTSVELWWPEYYGVLKLLGFNGLVEEFIKVSSGNTRTPSTLILKSDRKGAFKKSALPSPSQSRFIHIVTSIPKFVMRRIREYSSQTKVGFLLLKLVEDPMWVIKKSRDKIRGKV